VMVDDSMAALSATAGAEQSVVREPSLSGNRRTPFVLAR